MKFTIDTKVLKRHKLSLGEFLFLLMGSQGVDTEKCYKSIIEKGLACGSVISNLSLVLDSEQKELVAQILMQSDAKAQIADIAFEELAARMQELYPEGTKPNTTQKWRGTMEEVAQKLRVLWVKYNFRFTVQEALEATKEYVKTYEVPDIRPTMYTLPGFILCTFSTEDENTEISSMFMTTIETLRDKNKEKNENYN